MQVKKQQLELDIKQQTGSKLGKEHNKAVYCQPAYLTHMQSAACEMQAGWIARGIKTLPGETPTASGRQLLPFWWQKVKRSWRSSWWGWNRREKAGLKVNIQKTKIVAPSPISSQQTEGKKVEAVTDFIFLGSKITVDSDCHHEIKRCFLLGRKAMTNLGSVLKSRDSTLPAKGCIVKAMVSPVVMFGCESWTTKNAES